MVYVSSILTYSTKINNMKNINVELSKKEIRLINEACEWWMDQVKEDSTFENPNNNKFYDLWDIRNKIMDKII